MQFNVHLGRTNAGFCKAFNRIVKKVGRNASQEVLFTSSVSSTLSPSRHTGGTTGRSTWC